MTEAAETAALAADIVAAYVGNNKLSIGELPELISSVHKALQNAGAPQPEPLPTPAVPVKKSVTPEYLISLEDGRRYKSLKRHLATRGMSPDEYRTKWGLPKDYPMVAASYSAQRSNLAKTLGLGRKAAPAPAAVAAPEPKAKAPKAAKAAKAPAAAAAPARRRSKTVAA